MQALRAKRWIAMKNTIEINSKDYKIKKILAKDWREIFKFDENRKDILLVDFVDKHCEIIASVLEDVTAEELQDVLSVDEIMAIYNDILKYLLTVLNAKKGDEKNAVEGVEENQ